MNQNKSENQINKKRLHNYWVLVDIGNSAIKLAVADLDSAVIHQYLTCKNLTNCRQKINELPPSKIFYSSVRPSFDPKFLCPSPDWDLISANSCVEKGDLIFPESLDIGIDRKLACLAANKIIAQPFIVVTLGTAISLSLVAENTCNFSVIWPGLGLSIKAINNNTRIKVKQAFTEISDLDKTGKIEDSVNVGVLFSTVFALESWIEQLAKRHQCLPNVIITGGYSKLISKFLGVNHITEPHLTIKGLFELLSNQQVREQIESQNQK